MTTPKTLDDLEERPMENESEQGMSKVFLHNPIKIYTHSQNFEVVKRQYKTRASNRYQMNMKRKLHHSLKNEGMIDIEDSLREEILNLKK